MSFRCNAFFRSKCINCVVLLLALIGLVTVARTILLLQNEFYYPKQYTNLMELMEQRLGVQKTMLPNGTAIFQDLIGNISNSTFNNNTFNYSVIYETRFVNHVSPLVTSSRCPHSYHIILLITSEVTHFNRREWIRETWGRDHVSATPRWKTFFVVGKVVGDANTTYNLAKEIYSYNDIILVNVEEDYYNLVPKLQAGFEWSSKYCEYNYLLKGDDDVFVNIIQLFNFVDSAQTPNSSLYAGHAYHLAWVVRNGRYGISREEYWKDTYAPYCSGGGFVLSKDVPPKFLKVLNDVKVIRIDDAYIGELALKAEVNVYNHLGFQFSEDKKGCKYIETNIVHHPVKSWECMQTLYNKIELRLTQKLSIQVL